LITNRTKWRRQHGKNSTVAPLLLTSIKVLPDNREISFQFYLFFPTNIFKRPDV
jgi:hypothetical protein